MPGCSHLVRLKHLLSADGELRRLRVTADGLAGDAGAVLRHDQLSPVSYAADVTTPVLILHGEDDTNVPSVQANGWCFAVLR
jgi:fermentation-respiration switch protein FrsA (DUF1100 family)